MGAVRGGHQPPAGREVDDDEWHTWTFDGEGRVLTLRHLLDAKKHYDAWRG